MQTLIKNTQAYRLLKTESRENKIGHAYLLLLNDARNLRSALKIFAKLFFLCDEPTDTKSQRINELIDADAFSDCLFFPSDGKKLTVEDAEKILEESTLSPVETEKKVFLLGDFAEANIQTQNKLLKLLEEPPKNVILLLGATSIFPVLQTVLSRAKKLEILPFEQTDLYACLLRMYGDKFDEDTLSLCAAAANGSLGQAQNIVEGGQYKTIVENAFALANCSLAGLPALVRQVGETKYSKELLNFLRLIFRDALLLNTQKMVANNRLFLAGERARVQAVADKYSPATLIFAQEAITEAEKQVKFNAVFAQCIEVCISKIQTYNKE